MLASVSVIHEIGCQGNRKWVASKLLQSPVTLETVLLAWAGLEGEGCTLSGCLPWQEHLNVTVELQDMGALFCSYFLDEDNKVQKDPET